MRWKQALAKNNGEGLEVRETDAMGRAVFTTQAFEKGYFFLMFFLHFWGRAFLVLAGFFVSVAFLDTFVLFRHHIIIHNLHFLILVYLSLWPLRVKLRVKLECCCILQMHSWSSTRDVLLARRIGTSHEALTVTTTSLRTRSWHLPKTDGYGGWNFLVLAW